MVLITFDDVKSLVDNSVNRFVVSMTFVRGFSYLNSWYRLPADLNSFFQSIACGPI